MSVDTHSKPSLASLADEAVGIKTEIGDSQSYASSGKPDRNSSTRKTDAEA